MPFQFADQASRSLMKPFVHNTMDGWLHALHVVSGFVIVVLTEIMKYKVDSEVKRDMAATLIPFQCTFLYELPTYFEGISDLTIYSITMRVLARAVPAIQAVLVMFASCNCLWERLSTVYAPVCVLDVFKVGAVYKIAVGRGQFELTTIALCFVAALNINVPPENLPAQELVKMYVLAWRFEVFGC